MRIPFGDSGDGGCGVLPPLEAPQGAGRQLTAAAETLRRIRSTDAAGSGADRRLAALAAALLPDRAPALLSRSCAVPAALEETTRLAALPRSERLRALAAALAAAEPAAGPSPDLERPRVAAVVRAVQAGREVEPEVAPLVVRIAQAGPG